MRYQTHLLVCVVTAASLVARAGWASERRLRVLGSASVEAQVQRATGSRLRLEGRVIDDSGSGVPEAEVQLTLDRRASAVACGSGARLPLVGLTANLSADSNGLFCAEFDDDIEGSHLTLSYKDPAGFLQGAQLQLSASPAPGAIELRLGIPAETRLAGPAELSLDTPWHVFEVTALPQAGASRALESEENASSHLPITVELSLEAPHQQPEVLTELIVVPGERGRAELKASQLGSPGSAVLLATFRGNEAWTAAETRRHVLKTAQVHLEASPTEAHQSEGSTVELPVRVHGAGRPVESGSVEATSGAHRLGNAPVMGGEALLRLPRELLIAKHDAGPSKQYRVPVQITYVPSAPWWHSGPPAEVELVLMPPAMSTRLPWLLAALAVIGWVALIWRRPAGRRGGQPTSTAPPGQAGVSVVENGNAGWEGHVLDAHTAAPVASARIEVRAPGLEAKRVLYTSSSETDGGFLIPPDILGPETDQLSPVLHIRAAGYAALERPLPRSGRLHVHIVTLRRVIVARFLGWAKNKGYPWQGTTPPTPADVARTAPIQQQGVIASWARKVEAAAFGADPPDESVQRDLQDAEPP